MSDTPSARPLDAAALGPFIARVRGERGLTQRELAERLYVSDKTVSKWERGLSLPSVPLLMPLAEALGLSISELMSCGEIPDGADVGCVQTDRLVAASLGLSGAALTGRQRALRAAAFLGTVAVWGALAARVVSSCGIGSLSQALSDPAVAGGLLMLTAMAYFSFCCSETLPGYYDENRISFVAQGPFRMNLGGLVRIHNGNWPAVCRAGRWGAGVAAILMPAIELALGDVLSDAAIGFIGCALFFLSILVAGKLNE